MSKDWKTSWYQGFQGSKNDPLRSKDIAQLIKNPELFRTTNELFSALKKEHPEASDLEILEDIEKRLKLSNGEGLLKALSDSGQEIRFDWLSQEEFSLQELDELQLEKVLFLPKSVRMKKGLENALVSHIKQSFLAKVSEPLSQLLEHELFPNTRSLSELLLAIQQFPQILQAIQEEEKKTLFWEKTDEELNQDSSLKEQYQKLQKKYTDFQQEYLSFRDQFSLSFAELKTALEQNTPSINLDNLNTKPFSKWSEAQQKTFDTLFTKLVTQRLKTKVHKLKTLTQGVGDLFSKPLMPLEALTAKYPVDYEQLRTFAQQEKPELAARIAVLEKKTNDVDKDDENATSGLDTLSRELDECYWELYLSRIQKENPKLAQALKVLYEHNFDYTALETDHDLKQYFFSQLAEMRFEQMKKDQLLWVFAQDGENFKAFWTSLFDFSQEEININGLSFKIKKELKSQTNPDLKSLSEWTHSHELPLKITLSGINDCGLKGKDRKKFDKLFLNHAKGEKNTPWKYDEIELSSNEFGKLLLLFLMGSPAPLGESEPNNPAAQDLDELFEDSELSSPDEERLKKKLEEDEDAKGDEDNPDEEVNQTPEMKRKAFLQAWKGMRGEKSEAEDGGFKPGVEIYFSHTDSSLPPYGVSGKEWKKFKVTDVDWGKWTFKARAYGTEFKLPASDEGKEMKFAFENFKGLFLENDRISSTTKPFKLLSPSQNLEKSYKTLLHAGLCDENLFKDAVFDNGKLMLSELDEKGNEKTEEVKYFGSTNNADSKDNVLYKVKRNPNHTVTVSSSGLHDKKWDPKTYEKKMSIPDFLLFLNEKKLTPKTETIAKREESEIIEDIHSYKKGSLGWISMHSLVFSVKNIWKKINEGLDNYQKAQDEACLNWLTQDVGIYNLLNKGIGWLAPSLSDAFTDLHDKAIAEKEKNNWKSIEEWIGIFGACEFPDIFADGKDPATGQRLAKLDRALGKRKTMKELLLSRTCVINDDTLRPIMAAAMISNLKKGKGLYRGISEEDNKGLWIQCLLGHEHYQRYLQYKRNIQNDIDNGAGDADQLRDLLVKSEVNYIVWNIQNSHGNDKYFGSVKDENRQALKKIYSDKFAGQLNDAAEEMTGQGAIENSYSKAKKMYTFNIAEEEFKKCIKSSRIESGIGVLKRMGELAKEPKQRHVLAASMSYVTMSWILNKYAGKETMTWFDGLARSFMLPTAFFADKPYHQHYAWHILDQVQVEPKFSVAMKGKGLTEAQFSKTSGKVPYWDFLKHLVSWRTENAKAIDDYFLSLKTKEHANDPVLNKVKEVLWEQNPDNLDSSWRGNPKITWHYALNQTPATIEQNKSYNKSGFDGKDDDERNEKAAFWKTLLGSLENIEKDPDVKPDFFLKQFKTWFSRDGFSDANDVENISMLRTIAKASKDVWKKSITFEDSEYNIEFKVEAHTQKDVKNLIWYLFEGKVLKQGSCQPPVEFKKVLDFFVDYFTKHLGEICSDEVMKKVFDTGALEADDAKAGSFVNWKEYNSVIGKDDNVFAPPTEELDSAQKSKDAKQEEKRIKAWKKRYYKQDPFINRGLVDMEKHLRRINVAPPKLLSAGAGHITSS